MCSNLSNRLTVSLHFFLNKMFDGSFFSETTKTVVSSLFHFLKMMFDVSSSIKTVVSSLETIKTREKTCFLNLFDHSAAFLRTPEITYETSRS